MATTTRTSTFEEIIESGREGGERSLEAVRKFLDSVDTVFPHVGEDGPRRKIIDSAFEMTTELFNAWSHSAEKMVKVTREGLAQPRSGASS